MSKLHFFLRTNIDLWIFKMSKTGFQRHKVSAFPDWRHFTLLVETLPRRLYEIHVLTLDVTTDALWCWTRELTELAFV